MTAAKARAFWKKLSLKAHPDKGGDPALFREMTDAKEKWEDLVKTEAHGFGSAARVGPGNLGGRVGNIRSRGRVPGSFDAFTARRSKC